MIKIRTIGGYNEVGKNMTAVKIDDEVIILDMGLHLDSYIRFTENEDIKYVNTEDLRSVGAIPDDSVIEEWRAEVKAIIPTHAHLDHVGALPFLANKYKAPILCTPFAAEVLKSITEEGQIKLRNEVKVLNPNSSYKISDNINIEFINMTHSTPQTVMVAIHTKYGVIVYANDFKFDNHPVVGKKPNYNKLDEIGEKGVIALIVDCTRARQSVKTPSERVAREMLRDVMLGTNYKERAVIVTTFSSHIARLSSIIEFGKKMQRKIVFLGRSLAKYAYAAENVGIVKFSSDVEIVKYSSKIGRRLKQIEKEGSEKYLLVVTGHQGEPKSTLSKIANNELKFKLRPEDHIIFSCTVIPSAVNVKNRERLEKTLKGHGVRIFKDIHTSGHASREDLRDLMNSLRPANVIPAHGDEEMRLAFADLAYEKGYKKGKDIHLMKNGDVVKL